MKTTNQPSYQPSYSVGDVHAPVEDTGAPFGLKLLVIVMALLTVGTGVVIGLGLSPVGSFLLPH